MALSGTQRTRIAVGGPGLRYAGFTAKSAGPSTFPRGTVGPFTRLAVGGPGLRYAAFIAKGEAPVATGQGEQASTPAGIVRRRRRYVFPDGTRVMATEDEVRELLAEYVRMRVTTEARKEGARPRTRFVRVPPSELERIEWKQATDTADELLVAKLPNRILWKPEPKQWARDVASLRRRIDDEEAIIALLT